MATQHIITLDFETFYDTKFSLSRLTTEEYVRDNQFDIIGVGIKIDTEPAYWVSGPSDLLNKHGIKYKVCGNAQRTWGGTPNENKSAHGQRSLRAG
jgi:hypothetical protein